MREGTVAVQEGAQLTEQAGGSFNTISHAVGEVFSQIQMVSDAIYQLNKGSERVVTSIGSVRDNSNDF